MSTLTAQCRAGDCIDVSDDAAKFLIEQKVFVSRRLWEQYIVLDPESVLNERDPRLSLLLNKVREGLHDFPGHDTFPVLVEVTSTRNGEPFVLLKQWATATVTGNEVFVDVRE